MRCPRCRAAPLLFLLCAASLQLCYAQQPALTPPKEVPPWAERHIFKKSNDGPVTKALPTPAAASVLAVTNFLGFLDKDIQRNLDQQDKGEAESGKVETRTCNMAGDTWQKAAARYLNLRGVKDADTSCGTERAYAVDGPSADDAVRAFRPALELWATQLNSSAARIADLAGEGMRKSVAGVGRFVYPERDAQNCTVWHTLGVRVRDKWYVQARVTAKASETEARTDKNMYLVEHVRAVESRGGARFDAPLTMLAPIPRNDSVYEPTTTFRELWGRPAPDSIGQSSDVTQKLSFETALAAGDNENQQAQDAIQVSNIAILLLPLVMNLVPVAAIADVNTVGMLMYTALTDVLTTVPLGIKGIELIGISNMKFKSVSAQIIGVAGPNETAVAEVWSVSCQLKRNRYFRTFGITFLVVSLVLMVFGVVCEFVARAVVKRRRMLTDPNAPLLANEHGHGAGGSYQPFTAAALTLQNRTYSGRGTAPAGIVAQARGTGPALPVHDARAPNLGVVPAALAHGRPGPSAGPSHAHGQGCICACHSAARHQNLEHEYDSRPYPDMLDSKYQ